jgi:uncharacterized membrane protein
VSSLPRLRVAMRWAMAAFYLVAGIVHLVAPEKFLPIVPDFVPLLREVVLATGVCEIAGGLALLTTRLRWVAGVMLAVYAVFVSPANIKRALEGIHLPPVLDSWWYHGPRLLMQPVLVWWAESAIGVSPAATGHEARRQKVTRRCRQRSKLFALRNSYSITSSALSRIDCGTISPSALAVLRLTTISYFVGSCTGRSPGFAPRRMRST